MKKKLTHFLRLALGALSLGAPLAAQAGYTPIALTGFTADIIANGTGAVNTTTTADIDGNGTGYCLMAQNYVGPAGQTPSTTNPALPNGGLFNSQLNSALPFQLASYSANNTLRLTGANATGTLTFVTPQPAGELYILGTSGNATSGLTITVNFSDGSTQQFTGQSIADWFAGGQTNVALERIGRVSRADNATQYIVGGGTVIGPRLYQVRLPLQSTNYAKNIASITFLKPQAAGNAMIMAVTANSACTGTPAGGTTVASVGSACTSTSIALSLNGASTDIGLTYQWHRLDRHCRRYQRHLYRYRPGRRHTVPGPGNLLGKRPVGLLDGRDGGAKPLLQLLLRQRQHWYQRVHPQRERKRQQRLHQYDRR
jgi:hypothetical protein